MSSKALLTFVTGLHLIETFMLATNITVADWIFPLRSFLYVSHDSHPIAAAALGICTLCGMIAFINDKITFFARIILFMIQYLPIALAGLWIIGSALNDRDAYGLVASPVALLLNQAPRISLLILYPIAVRALMADTTIKRIK